MKSKFAAKILTLLTGEYGKRNWQINEKPVFVLIQTILSQNTSDKNSLAAFNSLFNTFGSWQDIADAPLAKIANAIKAGGLSTVKAKYIKQTLREIKHKRGNFELNFLQSYSLNEARNWLLELPGVGMKTASCVLLFSLGIPALPVDTHIYRITRRIGLINNHATFNEAHQTLESLIPKEDVYAFHVLLIEHGRKICKAQNPKCGQCVLNGICPSSTMTSNQSPELDISGIKK